MSNPKKQNKKFNLKTSFHQICSAENRNLDSSFDSTKLMAVVCTCCPTHHCESGYPCYEEDICEIMKCVPESVVATYRWLNG